jgi:hypothetical protein
VNYLIQIGLAVLLLRFEQECKGEQTEGGPVDFVDRIIKDQAISRLLSQAAETKIPRSELARLVNRSLYERPCSPEHRNRPGAGQRDEATGT